MQEYPITQKTHNANLHNAIKFNIGQLIPFDGLHQFFDYKFEFLYVQPQNFSKRILKLLIKLMKQETYGKTFTRLKITMKRPCLTQNIYKKVFTRTKERIGRNYEKN